jgi:hypothetical protein
MGESDPVGLVRRTLAGAETEIAAITRQNAARLLGLED